MCIRDRFAEANNDIDRILDELHNISVEPVSYTHLDVYKRQLPACPNCGHHEFEKLEDED